MTLAMRPFLLASAFIALFMAAPLVSAGTSCNPLGTVCASANVSTDPSTWHARASGWGEGNVAFVLVDLSGTVFLDIGTFPLTDACFDDTAVFPFCTVSAVYSNPGGPGVPSCTMATVTAQSAIGSWGESASDC